MKSVLVAAVLVAGGINAQAGNDLSQWSTHVDSMDPTSAGVLQASVARKISDVVRIERGNMVMTCNMVTNERGATFGVVELKTRSNDGKWYTQLFEDKIIDCGNNAIWGAAQGHGYGDFAAAIPRNESSNNRGSWLDIRGILSSLLEFLGKRS